MKKNILGWLAGCFGLAALTTAQAAMGYSTNFEAPPYEIDQTVIDVGGWTAGTITSGDMADARVVAAPWGGTALYLKSSQKFGNPGTVSVYQKFDGEPIVGSKIAIEAVVGFDIWSPSTNTNVNSQISFGSSTPVSFGFNQSAGGGLRFTGAEGTVVILDKLEVKPDSPYTFSFVLDFDEQVFDLTVTGLKKNDEAFEFTISGVGFQNPSAVISQITMTQNSTVLSGYLGSISIQPIPEPSGIALAAFGGLGLLGMAVCRSRFMK